MSNILSSSDKLFSWDHYLIAKEFIKENTVFLNLSGDFAEKLLSKKYSPKKINVIGGIDKSIKQALINSGAKFYKSVDETENESFNLITNRFMPFSLEKVKMKLKKGGHIIMEEYGFETYKSIGEALNIDFKVSQTLNLENRAEELKRSGFKLVTRNQDYIKRNMSKAEIKEVLSFFEDVKIDESLLKDDILITEHRFIYTAKKLN